MQRIAVIDKGINKLTVRYQLSDHLGSSCVELNENTDIISYEEYHPFGTTSYQKSNTSISQKRYKYVGKERDEETGLYYYGFRYYSAWICRFVSVDPMKEERIWLNPYNYVQNNPINRVDPTGMVDTNPPWKVPDVSTEENPVYYDEASKDTDVTGNYKSNIEVSEEPMKKDIYDKNNQIVPPIDDLLQGHPGCKREAQFRDDIKTISPVSSPVISSEYGERIHPIHKTKSFHKGLDIVLKVQGTVEGVDVVAPINGKIRAVKSASDGDGAGNRIQIIDKFGKIHIVMHMSDNNFGKGLRSGQPIQRGNKIGEVGNTGGSDGAHAHYEIRSTKSWGKTYNPREYNSGLKNAPTKKQVRAPEVPKVPVGTISTLLRSYRRY